MTASLNDVRRRFEALVDQRGAEECWLWRGTLNGRGYGILSVPGRGGVPAHRLALELAGVDLTELEVHHACYVAACCNPRHLEALTKAEHGERHRGDGYRPHVGKPVSKSPDDVGGELVPLSPRLRQQREEWCQQALANIERLEAERDCRP